MGRAFGIQGDDDSVEWIHVTVLRNVNETATAQSMEYGVERSASKLVKAQIVLANKVLRIQRENRFGSEQWS